MPDFNSIINLSKKRKSELMHESVQKPHACIEEEKHGGFEEQNSKMIEGGMKRKSHKIILS
jgi:hypothetical protein